VSFFDYGENSDVNSLIPTVRVTTQFGLNYEEITVAPPRHSPRTQSQAGGPKGRTRRSAEARSDFRQ